MQPVIIYECLCAARDHIRTKRTHNRSMQHANFHACVISCHTHTYTSEVTHTCTPCICTPFCARAATCHDECVSGTGIPTYMSTYIQRYASTEHFDMRITHCLRMHIQIYIPISTYVHMRLHGDAKQRTSLDMLGRCRTRAETGTHLNGRVNLNTHTYLCESKYPYILV